MSTGLALDGVDALKLAKAVVNALLLSEVIPGMLMHRPLGAVTSPVCC